jgi:uncharacterized phage protein (TIGR02218 family)
MTHDSREKSHQDGQPVELYEFSRGEVRWYYTGSTNPITYNSREWEPALLSRTGLELTDEKGRGNLKITCQRDFPVADLFRVTPPTDVILFSLHRLHVGETSGVVVWMGRILNAAWTGAKAELSCEPVATSLQRPGLRRLYQRGCPHVLYGSACGVVKAGFAATATLTAVSGATLTSAAFGAQAAGYYAGGFIEYDNGDGTLERRFILDHSGSNVVINIPLTSLAVGSQITAYPGCDHTTSTCRLKFANLNNYGGMPYMSPKNPFGGSALY